MVQQNKKVKALNTILFVVLIAFLIFYVYKQIDLGYKLDILSVSDSYDTYMDMIWIGLFVSFAGSVVGFFGRKSGNTFVRGLIGGFVLGVVILTIVASILSPDWAVLATEQGLDNGVPGIFNAY